MPTYLATLDISDLAQQYYGLVYEPPVITRTIGGDSLTGFVEYADIEWTMFPLATSGTLSFTRTFLYDGFRNHPVKVEFRDATDGAGAPVIEWTGRIQADALLESGGVRLRGSGFPRDALAQRIPTPIITLADFPFAVDIGKTPSYVMGNAQKLRMLYINDGDGGNYDYLLHLGTAIASLYALYRDGLNQGATLPTGAQSYEGVAPTKFVVSAQTATSGYPYVRVRFTERQVNTSGALVGVYADFIGDEVAKSSPLEALKIIFTHSQSILLNLPIDTGNFDSSKVQLAQLLAPRKISVDGVLGAHGRAESAQEYVRQILRLFEGRLGVNAAGQITVAFDPPPASIKMSLGGGPNVSDNNLIAAGTRERGPEADRPKRYVLDYRPDIQTGAPLFQRIKSVEATGRDVLERNDFIREHLTADLVTDRRAKIRRNEQDVVRGTVAPSHARILNEGDVFLYTWLPHGCEDEPRKVIRVRKELSRVSFDHRKWDADEWGYTPSALPAEYDAPPNSPPVTPGSILLDDPGPDFIVTAGIAVTASYQTIKTTAITIDTNGNKLRKWAFVEVVTLAVPTGFQDTVTVRLRNTTTGDNQEVAIVLSSNFLLFYPYEVFYAKFDLSQNEAAVNAGTHTIVLEIKSTAGGQTLYYGSSSVLQPDLTSEAYVRAQEWS